MYCGFGSAIIDAGGYCWLTDGWNCNCWVGGGFGWKSPTAGFRRACIAAKAAAFGFILIGINEEKIYR
jgi:hypothetical protein